MNVGTVCMAAGVMLLASGCASSRQNLTVQEASSGNLQIIGQVEKLTVVPSGQQYKARIDTGATTCSISALEIEPFERDGKAWVRFRMPLPGKSKELTPLMEYPVTRTASIKRHGATNQERPAVKLTVQLGSFEGLVEFTLTDRTAYDFPVLIGRNLLEGNMIVDVSASFLATESK